MEIESPYDVHIWILPSPSFRYELLHITLILKVYIDTEK